MKYLIFDEIGKRFRTKTGWVKTENELFEGEKMLSFATREEAEKLIKCGFKNSCSYGINKQHPLFKHC